MIAAQAAQFDVERNSVVVNAGIVAVVPVGDLALIAGVTAQQQVLYFSPTS